MKLTLKRDSLLKPLQMVMGVVENKPQSMAILANVLLKIDHQRLSITATNTEVELTGFATLEAVHDPINLTLPARKLLDICRSLPEEANIELSQDEKRILLKSNRSRFVLTSLPADEFPNAEDIDFHSEFSIAEQQLSRLLNHTHFAMAQQDVRYYLNGLLLDLKSNALRSVATDGHRLATQAMNLLLATDKQAQVILPRKSVIELSRLLSDSEDSLTVLIANSHICIKTDRYTFVSKLISGRFPDYQKVIPKNADKEIFVDSDLFKQGLQRVAILSSDKYRGVRIELEQNLMRIVANNPEHEVAEEELSIDYLAEPMILTFNVTYLIDILNNMPECEKIKFTFSAPNYSALIEPHLHNETAAYVVMPMQI